jgi:2,5-furandicarboxylate decarboxylase 1
VSEPEGPFGEFSYYYGADSRAKVCEVTAITHRADAIFVDIHPTHTEHRCLWLFPGREARLLARLREVVPDVRAVHIPLDGAGMFAFVSLEKRHNGDPTRVLLAALSTDVFLKHVVVVDPDIDIHDVRQVLWALALRFRADRDLVVVRNARGYVEDPSTYGLDERDERGGLVTKAGYDATIPLGGAWPERADLVPPAYADIDPFAYLEN